jgi:hypothetical protein
VRGQGGAEGRVTKLREAQIQDAIRKELGDVTRYPELVLWRNNVGQMIDAHGQRLVFGIGNPGGADLIGCFAGRFVALEIKTADGKQTEEQRRFEQLVNVKGGAYCVARSVEDAIAFVDRLRRGEA